ncbi:MAG: fumarylacetoacetate hydrolase family protein [Gemmatimonadetes bacterium]|nr:fumarylacetoacetate hydrolase family protein [Gemmatimonadota bacterium]
MGGAVPSEPLLFFKPPSALIGSGDAIVLPASSGHVEYEGEIALVLGRRLRHASPEEALAAVSHVLPLNDVTARDFQRADGQWTRAKGFDTFCPVGRPVPASPELLADLEVITTVDGEERQRGWASDMVFSVADVLAFASNIMTLEAGDLVTTGTPEGVGRLEPGMTVRVEIPGVGAVENPVRAG